MSMTSENPPKVAPQVNQSTAIGGKRTFARKDTAPNSATPRKWLWRIIGLMCAAIVATGAIFLIMSQFGGQNHQLVYYTVTRGDLPIAVTERGTIESQENKEILCEVDDVDGDNVRGTPISWIIRNGESVKKGDLLVELETSAHVERLDRQILSRDKAHSEMIQAQALFDNQKTQNETTEADAELQVKLAKLELKMFKDETKGTHVLEVEDIKRKIDDINTEILAAEAELELAKKDLYASESLFKLGYAGKSELDRSKLDVLKAEAKYASKLNSLRTQFSALKKKETYEKQKQSLKLDGDLATSERKLKQVKRDNEALMAQAKAKKEGSEKAFKKEEERMKRYQSQLKKCKILAPVDGMVAYAVQDSKRWWLEEIREGSPLRPRQHIMSIPNLSKMQVKTAVHESVIDQIQKGLRATVRLEAFPDLQFNAKVKAVAVLADQQSPESKVYGTIVTIDGTVDQLKPGMTAVVEIHIQRVPNVLSVPVQAVVQVGKESWCYVDNGFGVERRIVEPGLTNHKFVEIRKGLQEGDRVVLNPMVLVDESDTDQSALEPDQSSPEPTIEPKTNIRQKNTPPVSKNRSKSKNRKKAA